MHSTARRKWALNSIEHGERHQSRTRCTARRPFIRCRVPRPHSGDTNTCSRSSCHRNHGGSKQSTASCYVLRQLTPALQCKWHSVPSSHETQCSVAELFSPEKLFCPCSFCPVCSLIQSQITQQKPAVVEPQQVFFNSKNTTSHLLWLTNSAFSIIVT